MRKVAICGKGGSGKSSIVALLANELRKRGWQVLVVDSDESNMGLARMLGFEGRPAPLLELVGGKKQVMSAFSDAPQGPMGVLQQEHIHVSELPAQYVLERDGIRMVSVGKILQSLEGCACPMGVLSREFLGRLVLGEREIVLVDTEAGVEHFGRGVERSLDTVLAVTEPSFDALELAAKITSLAVELGIPRIGAVLNQVPSPAVGELLSAELRKRGVAVLGAIRLDPEVFETGLQGAPIRGSLAEKDMAVLVDEML